MSEDSSQITLLISDIEAAIVSFLLQIGERTGKNAIRTAISAYLNIHDTLTQNQLHNLTGYSLSSISTTLAGMLESALIKIEFIPFSYQHRYRISFSQFSFEYSSFSNLIAQLESIHEKVQHIYNQIDIEYSKTKDASLGFLRSRIHSLFNYFELQYRTLKSDYKDSHDFWYEAILTESSISGFRSMHPLYEECETLLIHLMVDAGLFSENSPKINHILSLFFTRGALTQQHLISLTSYSLSSISRILQKLVKNHILNSTPKIYQKPQMYYFPSLCIFLSNIILNTDSFIFSFEPVFQRFFVRINSLSKTMKQNSRFDYLQAKLSDILSGIRELHIFSERYTAHYNVYLNFQENENSISFGRG